MYLFVDCETTGLPKNRKAPITDLNNWPRIVQLAWARYDAKHRHLETKSKIVKPEGFTIPRDAQRIHGISTSRALAHGRPLKRVLKGLAQAAIEAKVVVAHNLQFDESVISAEFLRVGFSPPFGRKHRICTMIETTDFCRLPEVRLGVKAKLYTLQEANKVGEFRLDYWIPKEKSEVLTFQRTAGSRC